jgi:hypothetical protein
MRALYARGPQLPARLRMLMDGCPPELEAKRHRIAARQLVVRTVLAAAAGVRRTAYWNLAPEVPGGHDPYQMMHLLFGKLPLLDYEDGRLTHRYPAADTFALLADRLAGATAVDRIDVAHDPAVSAYRVRRTGRGPLLVAWRAGDTFDGEHEPPAEVELPWDGDAAGPAPQAVDALGAPVKIDIRAGSPRFRTGSLRFAVSVTPVLVG